MVVFYNPKMPCICTHNNIQLIHFSHCNKNNNVVNLTIRVLLQTTLSTYFPAYCILVAYMSLNLLYQRNFQQNFWRNLSKKWSKIRGSENISSLSKNPPKMTNFLENTIENNKPHRKFSQKTRQLSWKLLKLVKNSTCFFIEFLWTQF